MSAMHHNHKCSQESASSKTETSRRLLRLPSRDDVLLKAGKVCLLLEEWMIEQLGRTGAFLNVDLEAAVKETLKFRRQLRRILELRFAVGRDQEQCSHRGLVQVRRLALDHLNHHDPQTPHVHLVIVALPDDSTFHPQPKIIF